MGADTLADLEAAVTALERSSDDVASSSTSERVDAVIERLRALSRRPPPTKRRTGDANRAFDFAKYDTRAIALHVRYDGWTYHGFASQGASASAAPPTVERALFEALAKTRLVASADDVFRGATYARCGRTDRGVSGLGQIVTLRVRSNGAGDDLEKELDYVALLNRTLPDDVRALGWAPVDEALNARFDCKWRQYKYFFEKTNGLDVDAMREAARSFEGVHETRVGVHDRGDGGWKADVRERARKRVFVAPSSVHVVSVVHGRFGTRVAVRRRRASRSRANTS